MTPDKKVRDALYYLIGLCAIGLYCSVIYQNAYNIPKWDDFPEILQFLDKWLSADTVNGKYLAFISQTNEHILLVNHLIVLLQYCLVGHLNFAWLIYIGNIFYLGSAITLWFYFKNQSERAFCFAIIMLVSVNFYAYDSMLWAMTAISNQAVIFFSFFAIYIACRPNKNILPVMLLSTMAVFSQSNGLMVLLVIAAYFIHTKNWEKLKQWLAFSIAITGLYVYWFNPATSHQQVSTVFQQLSLKNYALTIPAFLAYFGGSPFTRMTITTIAVSLIIGTAIFTFASIQFQRKQFTNPTILVTSFLLLSILTIAAYRGLFIGPQVIFTSRYKMYGCYFLITGVFLSPYALSQSQKSITWKIATLLLTGCYFLWSFPANLPQAKVIDRDLFESLQRWVEDGDLRRARGFFIKDTDSYLFAALKNNTYSPMVLLPDENIIRNVKPLGSCPVSNDEKLIHTNDLIISHKNPNAPGIKITSSFSNQLPFTISLCSAQQSYQFEIAQQTNNNESVVYFIDRNKIIPESYEVFVYYDKKYYKPENTFINKPATR